MLHHLFGSRRSRRPARRGAFRPNLEALEDRFLPSGTPLLTQLFQHPNFTASTVPANGDVNPYGVAFVPKGIPSGGPLHPGDILVSNFNNSQNEQGTGTTIVDVSPSGQTSLFFQGQPGLGLTTALGVLPNGFVLVGNVPTTDGTSATVQAPGSLLILNRFGVEVGNWVNGALLDGPWDLTVVNRGRQSLVFISNVLSGTVERLDLGVSANSITLQSATQIASGYTHRPDPNALLIGPTGLAYDPKTGNLYVASTGDNTIYAIANAATRKTDAGTGTVVYQDDNNLFGPLALALLPNGDLVTSNGDAVNTNNEQTNQLNELVEFTPQGQFVAAEQVDPSTSGGAAFGLAVNTSGNQIELAAVDDASTANDLETFTVIKSS